MQPKIQKSGNLLLAFLLTSFLTFTWLNLHAQTSFDLRIDGFANGNPAHTYAYNMVPCVDGGFFMTGEMNWHEDYFVVKTDSAGNVEWSKKFILGYEIDPPNIIATNDSGFYFVSNQLDGHFGSYNVPTISKVDKFGNILNSRLIPNNLYWTNGNKITFCEVDSSNNDLLLMGEYYHYNGSNAPCCSEYYLFQLDSSLNIKFSTRLDNGVPSTLYGINMTSKKVYLNNQVAGYIVAGLKEYYSYANSYVYFLDSIGNLIWTRKYFDLQIRDFVQVDSSYFFISSKDLGGGTSFKSQIIKTDLSGNIIFSKELQHTGTLKLESIGVNTNSELLISGYYLSPTPVLVYNLLFQFDTSLNVIMSNIGVLPNSTYWLNSSPSGNLNSILLSKVDFAGGYEKAIFEKINYSNPLCNYTSLPITTTLVANIDSSANFVNMTYPLLLSYNPVMFIPEYFNYSSPCLTSGIEDLYDDSNLDLNVNPNPAKDYIELSINGTVSSSEVTIFNITGEAIFKIEMNGTNKKIPIADLSQGIYFVNVITEKKKLNAKFIKL